MSPAEEAERREGRDSSDADECTKALNTGDIQLVWEPLGQLTQEVEKVTLSGSRRTKDTKVLRMRKRVRVSKNGGKIQS